MAMESTPDSGVAIRNAAVAPRLAPCFLRLAAAGKTPQERWIVVDATTGSNALSQAKEFHAALDLTGVIVTKLDGSGKGGSIVAIAHDLGIPARFIGTGEGVGDLDPFDAGEFVDSIL